MRLTHNSLATIIAWVSSCLLAGGMSTFISQGSRTLWMLWGCFGLAAAIGLDIRARVRERLWMDKLKLTANKRYERDMRYEIDDKEANAAVREAITRLLGRTPALVPIPASRRTQQRHPCDLEVELVVNHDLKGAAGNDDTGTRLARVTNLSESGFEMKLTECLPHQRMEMIITATNGDRQKMFGEVLWDSPQGDGSIVVGGRFLDAAAVESD